LDRDHVIAGQPDCAARPHIHDQTIEFAREAANGCGLESRAHFHHVDAQPFPFESDSFDALICIDAINHFPDRAAVLREWHRVLRSGGRVVFTDPAVVTGPLTDEEIAVRGSISFFVFVPDRFNDTLLSEIGFTVDHGLDRMDNMAEMAARLRDARAEAAASDESSWHDRGGGYENESAAPAAPGTSCS
jgi:SAM-dependent methyltransferase